ncbi:MAG: addiction module protein [Candidatus Dadabacteria bacterium]|nr:addiction module protein [Candidatus Dadabacteria bacterium]MCY4262047.1 addiction module protein [Candidatus Dadabacteria bacterium]
MARWISFFSNIKIYGSYLTSITRYNLKNLPVDEQIRLVKDLWDNIASDQNPISLSYAQKAET